MQELLLFRRFQWQNSRLQDFFQFVLSIDSAVVSSWSEVVHEVTRLNSSIILKVRKLIGYLSS